MYILSPLALMSIALDAHPWVESVAMKPYATDECDALLGKRGDGENDAMRRLKNEFLQSFDGVSVCTDGKLSVYTHNWLW